MYDLSIIVPGIRPENWKKLLEDLPLCCGNLKYEVIFAGPYFCDDLKDTRHVFVRDFGSPSHSFAKAASLANGRYICQCSDDGIYFENGLQKAFDSIQSDRKKICIVRYTEGENYSGQEFPLSYWNIQHHMGCFGHGTCNGVRPEWDAGPVFMMNLEYYREMGGVDCRFEHLNLNVNDLIYRTYRDGGGTVLSPVQVISSDWVPNQSPNTHPCCGAFHFNDLPLFRFLYNSDEKVNSNPIKIDIENWRQSPEIWARRFK